MNRIKQSTVSRRFQNILQAGVCSLTSVILAGVRHAQTNKATSTLAGAAAINITPQIATRMPDEKIIPGNPTKL